MITYIIPTYERPLYLERNLRFFHKLKIPHEILIADASRPDVCDKNERMVASLSHQLKIRYDRYPHDINMLEKFFQAVAKVQTEYAVPCADDDFLCPHSVEKCMQYLKENPEYSAAQGIGFGFSLSKDPVTQRQIYQIIGRQSYPSIECANVRDRLLAHFSNYRPTFYAVHRTQQLRYNLEKAVAFTSDPRFLELLPSALTVIQGKIKRFDFPHEFRDSQAVGVASETNGWPEIIFGNNFTEKYLAFKKCLSVEIAKTGEGLEKAGEIVKEASVLFFAWSLGCYAAWSKEDRREKPLGKKGRGLRAILKTIPFLPELVHLLRGFQKKEKTCKVFSPESREIMDLIKEHVLEHADQVRSHS